MTQNSIDQKIQFINKNISAIEKNRKSKRAIEGIKTLFSEEIPLIDKNWDKIGATRLTQILENYKINLILENERINKELEVEKLKNKTSIINQNSNFLKTSHENNITFNSTIEIINSIPESDLNQMDKIEIIRLLQQLKDSNNNLEKEISTKDVLKFLADKSFSALKELLPLVIKLL